MLVLHAQLPGESGVLGRSVRVWSKSPCLGPLPLPQEWLGSVGQMGNYTVTSLFIYSYWTPALAQRSKRRDGFCWVASALPGLWGIVMGPRGGPLWRESRRPIAAWLDRPSDWSKWRGDSSLWVARWNRVPPLQGHLVRVPRSPQRTC
jgi:hypothetical protein